MKSLFLCESCGKAVSYKAHRCPHCGRFFTAVVCPQCKYTGNPKEFLSGCPVCGYLSVVTAKTGKSKKKKHSMFSSKKKKSFEFPSWFYKSAVIILAVLLVILIFWYFSSI